jgi:hypothetical protein
VGLERPILPKAFNKRASKLKSAKDVTASDTRCFLADFDNVASFDDASGFASALVSSGTSEMAKLSGESDDSGSGDALAFFFVLFSFGIFY